MLPELHSRGYRLGPRLGKGSYAKVKLAQRLLDGRVVAIKIINKQRASTEFVEKFLPRELSVHLTLQHDNLIRIYEVIHQPELVCVVMEHAARGDLLAYVKHRGWLTQPQAGPLFSQVCQGLAYLHSRHICHRDLKCENILLKLPGLTAALSDFSFARTLEGRHTLCQTYCGSAAYASPELLRGRPYLPLGNDVWSLGCVLFIMVTGQMPFYDKNTKKMLNRQLKGKLSYPERRQVSPLCREVIGHALEPNMDVRWDVHQILAHSWVIQHTSTHLQHTSTHLQHTSTHLQHTSTHIQHTSTHLQPTEVVSETIMVASSVRQHTPAIEKLSAIQKPSVLKETSHIEGPSTVHRTSDTVLTPEFPQILKSVESMLPGVICTPSVMNIEKTEIGNARYICSEASSHEKIILLSQSTVDMGSMSDEDDHKQSFCRTKGIESTEVSVVDRINTAARSTEKRYTREEGHVSQLRRVFESKDNV